MPCRSDISFNWAGAAQDAMAIHQDAHVNIGNVVLGQGSIDSDNWWIGGPNMSPVPDVPVGMKAVLLGCLL